MEKFALLLIAAAGLCAPRLCPAGDAVAAPRKQFRQSTGYPFVFRPECYLATTGPAPLRFATAAPACDERSKAPKLPAPTPKPEPPKSDDAKSAPAQEAPAPGPAPAYPPPANGPANRDQADLTRVPDEVLEFFRDGGAHSATRHYLFDPIFMPAQPNELPKSKATYRKE